MSDISLELAGNTAFMHKKRLVMCMSDIKIEQPRLLTPSEFAKAIGKTERQVYRYIKMGKVNVLLPEETGLSGNRIPATELERFIEVLGGDINLNDSDLSSSSVRSSRLKSKPAEKVGKGKERSESPNVQQPENDTDTASHSHQQVKLVSAKELEALDLLDEQENEAPLVVPLERHEAAVMRLGYLQSQLERTRLLISDGTSKEADYVKRVAALEEAVKQNERELLRAEARAEAEADSRREAEARARSFEVRLQEAERYKELPWWKKIFV